MKKDIDFLLNKLAGIKLMMKQLEAEAEETMTNILSTGQAPKKFVAYNGQTMTLIQRENWGKPGNKDAIKVIGQAMFLEHASITLAEIRKVGGEIAVNKLIKDKAVERGKDSVFYSLK